MPKTANPRAARGRRRGTHREKRLKMLEAKPHWLASEAPVGEYHVDTVAWSFSSGALPYLTTARMHSSDWSERT